MNEIFTPSETVFLHGEQFAKPKKDGVKLPRGTTHVDPDELAEAMIAAALLANDNAGALRMEVGVEKRLFGLWKARVVHLVAGAAPRWPEGTLEARVWALASKRPKSGEWSVRDVVRNLFPHDAPNPHVEVALWVRRALEARGLADEVVEEKKTLGIFKTRHSHSVLTSTGTAVAERHPAAPVQAMISGLARERAEVAERMRTEIRGALSSRVESSSNDSNFDSSSD